MVLAERRLLHFCERCGREFTPKRGTAGRFCSRKCYERCKEYRPDHNGECLNCDDGPDAHRHLLK